MSDVTVVRWRKFGKDRLYVNGPGEQRLGWCDVLTGAIDVDQEHNRSAVEAAVDAWRAKEEISDASGTLRDVTQHGCSGVGAHRCASRPRNGAGN